MKKMKFNNKPNTPHDIDGKVIWEKRSVAVVGCTFIDKGSNTYVLVSRRGQKSPDFQGKMNLVAGYLDWDETGTEAVYRETWEETGFNLPKYMKKFHVSKNDLNDPWKTTTSPNNNLQNVTLRYGALLIMLDTDKFPKLTTKYNEVPGETEDPIWMPITDIHKYEWAFEHDKVIESYDKRLNKNSPRGQEYCK
jgi:ADP-ribose pyrophosphatase YjhB (NUDIX family)